MKILKFLEIQPTDDFHNQILGIWLAKTSGAIDPVSIRYLF